MQSLRSIGLHLGQQMKKLDIYVLNKPFMGFYGIIEPFEEPYTASYSPKWYTMSSVKLRYTVDGKKIPPGVFLAVNRYHNVGEVPG